MVSFVGAGQSNSEFKLTDMRILYINHELRGFDSEAGVWGREVVRELRSAGAEVVSLQDLDNGRPTPATPGRGLLAGVKTMVNQ